MPRLILVKKFEFEAAHRLPNYQGPCNRCHGHSYILEIGISGPVDLDSGMIMDFKALKALVKDWIIEELDHQYLNDVKERDFPDANPTAENMVLWIVDVLTKELAYRDRDLQLTLVRLWETSGSRCEWVA